MTPLGIRPRQDAEGVNDLLASKCRHQLNEFTYHDSQSEQRPGSQIRTLINSRCSSKFLHYSNMNLWFAMQGPELRS